MRCWFKDNTVWATEPKFDIPTGDKFCFCVDSKNNTFSCERRVDTKGLSSDEMSDFLYCEFPTGFNSNIKYSDIWNII